MLKTKGAILHKSNKDLLIEELFDLLRKGKIRFPWKSYEHIEWLIDHCTSMESKIRVSGGQPLKTFVKGSSPNDGLMALMYAYMAYKFDLTKGFTIKPGLERKSEYPKATLARVRRAEISWAVNRDSDTREAATHYGSIAHSPGFRHGGIKKTASIASPMPGPSASSTTDRMAPEIYSPLFQLANLNLPRDRVTMNAWNRVFYDTHPIVRNAINLHASYSSH